VRVHIASDVHGAGQALARAAEGSDVFVCLGDLILFLDYDDPGHGIYADLFGVDHARRYIELRTANRFEEARALSHAAWERIGITDQGARYQVLESMVRVQYEELFAAMPSPAFLTYGNVDIPRLWADYLRPGHVVVDKQVIEVDGQRWGFLGGGLVSPMRTPHEIDPDEYAWAVSELTYDTVARRFEVGSVALRSYVEEHQPRYHFFGHVHQPLSARTRIGRTECVNVGHFHGREAPFVVDL